MIRNLVFKGGGVKGAAYAGAVEILEHAGVLANVRRVAGTSAGAITATLLACGATPTDLYRITSTTSFRSFTGASGLLGALGQAENIIDAWGLHSSNFFALWLAARLKELRVAPEVTFEDLSYFPDSRELTVIATDLTAGAPVVFSAERTPRVRIVDAVRASMSIPIFFEPYTDAAGHVLVDGGCSWNYPITVYDEVGPNQETLGLWIDPADDVAYEQAHGLDARPRAIVSLTSYVESVIGFLIDAANHGHLAATDADRTIFISSGRVRATDFDLSNADVANLVENGKLAAIAWLKGHPQV